MNKYFLTIDLGASSGRLIVSKFKETTKEMKQHEIHRFKNSPIIENSRKVWDFKSIMEEIKLGMIKAFDLYPLIESIGIDSFGVDFGLLDSNNSLIRNPISYRDLKHIEVIDELHRIISIEDLYQESGIQQMDFNTIYQLYYLANYEYKIYKDVKTILLIPDLIAFYLTCQKRTEITNLSTTSLFNIDKLDFIDKLDRLNLDCSKFPRLITPKEKYGYVNDDIKKACSIKNEVKVVAVCTHDTASAVLTVPKDNIYISSGTWSLIGTHLNKRNITNQSFKTNFTNEVGYKNQIRYLKNTMGLWLLNNFVKEYKRNNVKFDYLNYLNKIKSFGEKTPFIDIDSPEFYDGENIEDKITDYLRTTNQNIKIPKVDYIKIILFSMALKYRSIIDKIEYNTNKVYKDITIIGGGNQIDVLNQLTSDICKKNVVIGCKEATALGNAIVLMLEAECISSKDEAIIDIKNKDKIYKPKKDYESIYEEYLSLIQGVNNG